MPRAGRVPLAAALLFACAACAPRSVASLTCPTSSTTSISCYCSAGCSSPPTTLLATPVSISQGTDTICATVSGTCAGSIATLYSQFMGTACTAGSNFTVYTALSQSECTVALNSGLQSLSAYLCTSNNCNSVGTAALATPAPATPSSTGTPRAAAAAAAALAAGVAAALL